ncbi:Isoquinoline 1-oxidoreductase subunit alpha [Pseudovibrio sp. W64]|uniref:(2Fe-2S)-binding protein n=1 Tax=unclassified Pseudovibrio TaxID=2627060 RepID=UPI0007AEBDD8|nr:MULTISPECIES: (2Fe-2S)-binding protein [unclassified Pseudovibrio]KZK86290.1 Isoquinoline 1-oxidoreductase subunit alpha [Pseudovibrio sp. W64]KZK92500.1 Isoquinoline 1-oxidoreductase subunit alpha [Pseudovibrio sp. Ad46]KZK97260.1 Isoquinoline 1-oxidoreductase subunit alpha [Pseudovibrio sp. Ad5]
MRLIVNGSEFDVPDSWQDETLLMVLREQLGFVGPKLGCGQGECGACTVHINGEAARSCSIYAIDVQSDSIATIEGLASADGVLHPVQQAWLDERVAQCGYCQAGQIMQAAALLNEEPDPDDQTIIDRMSNNLCRCGTYKRINLAIKNASQVMQTRKGG